MSDPAKEDKKEDKKEEKKDEKKGGGDHGHGGGGGFSLGKMWGVGIFVLVLILLNVGKALAGQMNDIFQVISMNAGAILIMLGIWWITKKT